MLEGFREEYHIIALADDFADETEGAGANDTLDFVLLGGIGVHSQEAAMRTCWEWEFSGLKVVEMEDRWCKQIPSDVMSSRRQSNLTGRRSI